MFFASHFSFRTFAQFCNAICRKLIDTSRAMKKESKIYSNSEVLCLFWKRGLGNCWRMKMKNSESCKRRNSNKKYFHCTHIPGIQHVVYCSFPYYRRFSTHTSHSNAYEQSSLQGRKILEKSILVGAFSLLAVMQFLSHANTNTYTHKQSSFVHDSLA